MFDFKKINDISDLFKNSVPSSQAKSDQRDSDNGSLKNGQRNQKHHQIRQGSMPMISPSSSSQSSSHCASPPNQKTSAHTNMGSTFDYYHNG